MAKRITHDIPIGMSMTLLQSVNAWARHFNKPRSEYCREILERHQQRIGFFPKETDTESPAINQNPLSVG
jgi:predicted DNA-binding protein